MRSVGRAATNAAWRATAVRGLRSTNTSRLSLRFASAMTNPRFSDSSSTLSGPPGQARDPLYLEGGTLIDGTGADARPNPGILIQGDEIVAVGDSAKAKAQSLGARVVDATGQFVLPGLIDCHCHVTFGEPNSNDELFFHRQSEGLAALIAGWGMPKILRAGCTSILDADVMYNLGVDVRDAIEIGVLEGPRMTTGGNALLTALGGTAGRLIPDEGTRGYAQIVRGKDDIITTVRRQIKNGADWIKVHVTGFLPRQASRGEVSVWSREELRTVVETAHALHTPVVAHCRNAGSTIDAAECGIDLILHATNMDEKALDAVVKAGTALVPTLAFQANLADYGKQAGASPALIDLFRKEIDSSSAMLKKAYDAGVPILCGSESGFCITPLGEWHGREIEVLVKHIGLTPLQAITCATKEGARAMRLEGKLGTIEEGKLADIIVVDQDPLQDVKILNARERMKHVISKGRQVDLDRPWPTRSLFPGEKVGVWTSQPLTRELARSIDS
eukprot:TRINITY_DN114418_c0_g1_i1.p1 TRINITY_DN114418_c0_g1~~TRINITY_DN114418_c0_g1_i1.p1  ORF type:complete len:503 (-),score=91.71 TRINITY_DN114418_c0_g1_i1:24-1532(-)